MSKIKLLLSLIVLIITGCSSNDSSVPEVVPQTPSSLTGVLVNNQVNLTWVDNSTNEVGFKIERKLITGSFSVIYTAAANSTSYSDTSVLAGQPIFTELTLIMAQETLRTIPTKLQFQYQMQ